jgi:hypothetical protein
MIVLPSCLWITTYLYDQSKMTMLLVVFPVLLLLLHLLFLAVLFSVSFFKQKKEYLSTVSSFLHL